MAGLPGLTIATVSRRPGKLEADGSIRRAGSRGIDIDDAARLDAVAG
jgi:CRP-like cAMP-binding protein